MIVVECFTKFHMLGKYLSMVMANLALKMHKVYEGIEELDSNGTGFL